MRGRRGPCPCVYILPGMLMTMRLHTGTHGEAKSPLCVALTLCDADGAQEVDGQLVVEYGERRLTQAARHAHACAHPNAALHVTRLLETGFERWLLTPRIQPLAPNKWLTRAHIMLWHTTP